MASQTVAAAVQPGRASAASHAGADGGRGAERHAAAAAACRHAAARGERRRVWGRLRSTHPSARCGGPALAPRQEEAEYE